MAYRVKMCNGGGAGSAQYRFINNNGGVMAAYLAKKKVMAGLSLGFSIIASIGGS
jgi:hypothetical protein